MRDIQPILYKKATTRLHTKKLNSSQDVEGTEFLIVGPKREVVIDKTATKHLVTPQYQLGRTRGTVMVRVELLKLDCNEDKSFWCKTHD